MKNYLNPPTHFENDKYSNINAESADIAESAELILYKN